MSSKQIHFQNPDNGAPMVLVQREHALEVVACDEKDDATIAAAREMTVQLREVCITDMARAIRYLRQAFGVDA